MQIKQIAYIRSDFVEKFGIPRQSNLADTWAEIHFLPEYQNADALREIEAYDYLWLIWEFSESIRDTWSPTVRPPRLGGNRRVGVFATRSPFRPNPIGLSSVKLIGVEFREKEGPVLIVEGADLLDMTPIYDIKPYLHTWIATRRQKAVSRKKRKIINWMLISRKCIWNRFRLKKEQH